MRRVNTFALQEFKKIDSVSSVISSSEKDSLIELLALQQTSFVRIWICMKFRALLQSCPSSEAEIHRFWIGLWHTFVRRHQSRLPSPAPF